MFHKTKQKKDRRGVTATEYAIVFPIILFTFFGLWEYARLEMIRQATATACYDAAREGTLPGATPTVMDAAAQRILDIYDIDGSTITSSVTNELSQCQITVPIDDNTWLAFYVLNNRNITSECEFNRELFGN